MKINLQFEQSDLHSAAGDILKDINEAILKFNDKSIILHRWLSIDNDKEPVYGIHWFNIDILKEHFDEGFKIIDFYEYNGGAILLEKDIVELEKDNKKE